MSTTSSPTHLHYLRLALTEALKSPPRPTNFCVGAVLLCPSPADPSTSNTNNTTTSLSSSPPQVITGYTLELPGNTHAEQCCFLKALNPSTPTLPAGCTLYTTMEPCNKRSVGNKPCVDRIIELKTPSGEQAISTVYVGVLEPETFVGVNEGRNRLEAAGIQVVKVEAEGLEEEILAVATAGHAKGERQGAGG